MEISAPVKSRLLIERRVFSTDPNGEKRSVLSHRRGIRPRGVGDVTTRPLCSHTPPRARRVELVSCPTGGDPVVGPWSPLRRPLGGPRQTSLTQEVDPPEGLGRFGSGKGDRLGKGRIRRSFWESGLTRSTLGPGAGRSSSLDKLFPLFLPGCPPNSPPPPRALLEQGL